MNHKSFFDLPQNILIDMSQYNSSIYGALLCDPRFVKQLSEQDKVNIKNQYKTIIKDDRGTIRYYLNGKKHRDDDEPAVICKDGTLKWYKNGKKHRDGDKPAFVCKNQFRTIRCCEACDFGESIIKNFKQEKWFQHGKLHRDGGPALLDGYGSEEWFQYGQEHRDDGPAVYDDDGFEQWYQYGQLHREDGPAVTDTYSIHKTKWYINGKKIKSI